MQILTMGYLNIACQLLLIKKPDEKCQKEKIAEDICCHIEQPK